jgi:hypothetical protein
MLRMMKLMCVSAAVIGLISCAHTSNPLVGSWRLVSRGGEPYDVQGDAEAPVKILNDARFAFGGMKSDGTVFSGGGRYEFRDSTYTEMVEYHWIPFLVGRRLTFRCLLKGDRWYHSGSFDIDGRYFNVDEVWRKIDVGSFRARQEGARMTARNRSSHGHASK